MARDAYKKWLASRWFAPGDLKKIAVQTDQLAGIYVPHWTYDSETTTDYRGQRGTNYTTTETYTAYEDGKPVSKTRTVTKTRWRSSPAGCGSALMIF